MNIFNDDKTQPFHCSVGNFQVLFPEMLQDLWGNIIPAAVIWLLKSPSSSNVLRWVKLVHSESFLFSLGTCRQLRLTLTHACLVFLGCFLLLLRVDDLVAAQGTHELFNSLKEGYFI